MSKKKIGIIGYPLGHSWSPQIHNTAFRYHQLNCLYEKIEIIPDDFQEHIKKLKSGGWAGFNVTIPYKEMIFPYLDFINPSCKQIGAVNTIKIRENGAWEGFNTDFVGFLFPIKNVLDKISSCLVIGSGGAARAACFGLMTSANLDDLMIINRTLHRAEKLVEDIKSLQSVNIRVSDYDSFFKLNTKFDLIVNTTSIGMGESEKSFPLDPTIYSKENTIVYDLIYNPLQSEFLKVAHKAGLTHINGLPMLIRQAEESFKIWTSYNYPTELVEHITTLLTQKIIQK